MKNKNKLFISFFIIAIIFLGLFVALSYDSNKKQLIEENFVQINSISNDKMQEINEYLFGIEKDILILKESDEIKSILKSDLQISGLNIKKNVMKRAKEIAEEIEAYLITHPNMTLKDLQDSDEFKKIAIQAVGNKGYTAVTDCDTLINRFHPNPDIINMDFSILSKELPEFWSIMSKTKDCTASEGFYDWKESDGKITKKYMYIDIIDVKTKDGTRLSVAATTYLDDYKVIGNISEKAKNYFNNFKDYSNLVLISPEGYVSYATNEYGLVGANLNWEINSNKGLAKNYFDVIDKDNLSFYGPFIESYGAIYPQISVMAPVYEGKRLIGYIGIIEKMDEIFKITRKIMIPFSETEESYLVNEDLLLISPLRNADFDMFVQTIDTKSSKRCFNELEEGTHVGHPAVDLLVDYKGNEIIGAHEELKDLGWCLLTEIDLLETSLPLRKLIMKKVYFSVLGILILSFIGFFIGSYMDKRNIQVSRSELFKKMINLFTDLKLWHSILISLIFCLGYFFLVTSLFQGWQNASWYDDISDLSAVFVLIILFFYGFRLKRNLAKKLIVIGSFLAIIDKLIQIILEEYIFKFDVVSSWCWIPGAILGFIGLFLMLLGFKEVLK